MSTKTHCDYCDEVITHTPNDIIKTPLGNGGEQVVVQVRVGTITQDLMTGSCNFYTRHACKKCRAKFLAEIAAMESDRP